MARNDLEDIIDSSSCIDQRNMVHEGVEDSVLDKSNENTIHSGHFMVSSLKEEPEEESDDEEKATGYDFDSANKQPTETYEFGQKDNRIDIDSSLTKLFQCMSLAYSGKLTSPKWKNFKGLKLTIKDKVRLNNIIWREWHMQYIQGKFSRICQFEPPITDKTHTKAEAVVLEGKYWKRKLASVTAEYQKWRLFHKQRHIIQKDCDSLDNIASHASLLQRVGQQSSVFRFGQTNIRSVNPSSSPDIDHLISDEDIMDLSDTLFSTFNNRPFAFPDPRDFAQLSNADIIQPGLLQLQPTFEEDMDTQSLEPLPSLQEMMSGQGLFGSSSRSSGTLGSASAMMIDCPPSSPITDVLFCGSDSFFSVPTSNSTPSYSSQDNNSSLSLQVSQEQQVLNTQQSQPVQPRRNSAGNIADYYDANQLETNIGSSKSAAQSLLIAQGDSSMIRSGDICNNQRNTTCQIPPNQLQQQQPQQQQQNDTAIQLLNLIQQLFSGGQIQGQQAVLNVLSQLQNQNTPQEQKPLSGQENFIQQLQNQQQHINQQQQEQQSFSSLQQQQQQPQRVQQLQQQKQQQSAVQPQPTQQQLPRQRLVQVQSEQPKQQQALHLSRQKQVALQPQQIKQQQSQQLNLKPTSDLLNNKGSVVKNFPTKGRCILTRDSHFKTETSKVQSITYPQLQHLLQGQGLPNSNSISSSGNYKTVTFESVPSASAEGDNSDGNRSVRFETVNIEGIGSAGRNHKPVTRSTSSSLFGLSHSSHSSPTLSGQGARVNRQRSKSGDPITKQEIRRHSAGNETVTNPRNYLDGFRVPHIIPVRKQVKIAPAPGPLQQSGLVSTHTQAPTTSATIKPSPVSQNTFLAKLLTSDLVSSNTGNFAMKVEDRSLSSSYVPPVHIQQPQQTPHHTPHFQTIKPKPIAVVTTLPSSSPILTNTTFTMASTASANKIIPISASEESSSENCLSDYEKGLLIAANSQVLDASGSAIKFSDILNNSVTIAQCSNPSTGNYSNPSSPQFQVPSPAGSSDSPSGPRSRHASNESLESSQPTVFSLGSVKEEIDVTGQSGGTNSRRRSELDPSAYKEHRRASHINAEQKRRYNIKNGFDTLCQLVPTLTQNPNAKISKAAILHKSAEYCEKLKKERAEMHTEAELLKHEIESINTAISTCQSQLPATGVPVTRQRANQMKEKFEEYVRQRTMQNWKFWIFSIIIQPLFDTYNTMVSMATMEDLCRTTLAWLDQHCSLPSLRPGVLNSLRELSTSTSILSDPSKVPNQALQAVQSKFQARKNTDSGSSEGTPL